MGSGCNSSCNNIFGTKTPDNKVQYTGPSIPALGICTNDMLNEIEAVILQKLIDYSTGVSISIPDIDLSTCAAFTDCLTCCGTCTDLPCLLNCYKNAICSIFDDVATLKIEIEDLLNGPYDTACLTNQLPTNPTLNQIIQELIKEFCALQSAFGTLQTTVAGITANLSTNIGNFLLGAITTCTGTGSVIKSGTGATASIAFKGFVPVGGIIPFGGVTAGKFDSTGLGLAGTDFCGWAVANGNNGTINMMGQVPVGLTNMGGTLPINATGLSLTAIGTQIGEVNHTLISTEAPLPVHTHGVNDPGHGHQFVYYFQGNGGSGSQIVLLDKSYPGVLPPAVIPPDDPTFTHVNSHTTGVTIQNAGGGSAVPHNNIQPSTGLLYIQRIS